MMRSQRRWAALAWLISVAASVGALESPNFSFYPAAAIPCLDDAGSVANCERETVPEMNACLCRNGGNFIINAAGCLGRGNIDDVQEVYTTMSNACSDSTTPMSISQQEFFDAVNGNPPDTTSSGGSRPSNTPESSGPSNTDNNDSNGGLSQGAIIGIAAGGGVAGLAAIAGLALFLIRRRRRRDSEASNPFAQDYRYSKATTIPPSEPSPNHGSEFASDVKSWSGAAGAATAAHSVTPDTTHQSRLSTGWGSPALSQPSPGGSEIYHKGQHQHAFASSPYDAPSTNVIAELPHEPALPRIAEPVAVVAEMDGTGVPERRSNGMSMPGFTPGQY